MKNWKTGNSSGARKVLVAEDNFLVQETIIGELESAGFQVVGKAVKGSEVVEKVQTLRPDVVLMDIKMPDMDGLEAAKRISEVCPTPVVILTAYDTKELVDRAVETGVGAYLVKPPDSRELDRAISIATARFRDMLQLRERNKELEDAKRKIELLIKEIHHRVKNNLAMIASLLSLQSNSLEDPAAKSAFENTRDRIRSMELIHEKIYHSDYLSHIDAPGYFKTIITQLNSAYGSPQKPIDINANVDDVSLPLDCAIPCGIILNELLTNALKHSAPDGGKGEVIVEFHKKNKRFVLSVGDNGVGLPAHVDLKKSKTLGLRLIDALTRQLKGEINLERSKGTLFQVTFPVHDAE